MQGSFITGLTKLNYEIGEIISTIKQMLDTWKAKISIVLFHMGYRVHYTGLPKLICEIGEYCMHNLGIYLEFHSNISIKLLHVNQRNGLITLTQTQILKMFCTYPGRFRTLCVRNWKEWLPSEDMFSDWKCTCIFIFLADISSFTVIYF